MFLTIIIFALVLSVLVFAHEWGHFFTARRCGVRAEEFGFGFPPRAIGWYKNRFGKWRKVVGNRAVESLETSADEKLHPAKGATIYSLNWLPIGGFVKIKGENGDGREEGDSFAAKKIRQRVLILAAGVLMNVFLAWILFSVGYMIGLPQSTDDLGRGAKVGEARVMIAQILPDSPAESAGLLAGDAVVSVGGVLVSSEKSMQDAIASSANQETELLIEREGITQKITVKPAAASGGRAVIGVAIFASGTVRYPFFVSFWEGAKMTVWTLSQIVTSFYDFFRGLIVSHEVAGEFAGPVGIASITGQAARLGFAYLLQFTALLSLNLAIINILPLPALDGGRIFFLLIEKLKGRPVRRELETLIHNIGFLLLIALVIFITYKDIIKLF